MTVGERIKKAREHCDISQTDLAKRIGVSKQSLYKYEANVVTNIPSNVIEQIANIIDVSPCYLMGWEEKEHIKKEAPKIMQYYERLNDIGKHVATERVKELTEVPRYMEYDPGYVNAAHADDYIEAPEDLRQQEENIMDDENFGDFLGD